MVYEVKFTPGVIWATVGAPQQAVRRVLRKTFSKCQLPNHYWLTPPIAFYEAVDIIVETHEDEEAYVAARGEEALGQLGEELLESLDRHK